MASKNTFRTVLSVIKSAPHALTTGEIKRAMGVRSLGSQDSINEAVKQLYVAGYLKRTTQKSDRGYNRYFTNSTVRTLIGDLINGRSCVLPGIVFTVSDAPAATPAPQPQTPRLTKADFPVGTKVKRIGRTIIVLPGTLGEVVTSKPDDGYGSVRVKWNGNGEHTYSTNDSIREFLEIVAPATTTGEAGGLYKGAKVSALRSILKDIKSAPSSVHVDNFGGGLLYSDFNKAFGVLVDEGFIKLHADRTDHYFTRKPMRAKIDAFIASGNIADLTGESPAMPVHQDHEEPAVTSRPTPSQKPWEVGMAELSGCASLDSQYRAALGAILGNPNAVSWAGVPYHANAEAMCKNLTKAGLTKEHRDKPGYYFTRKPNRELIGKFLARVITLEQLFTQAKQPGQLASRQPRGYAEFESDDYRGILDAMRGFEHSVSRDDIEMAAFGDVITDDPSMAKMIGFLKDAGLIKEDSQKANYWFTRKPNRELIDAFIEGRKTLAQLFSEAKRPTRG